MPTTRARTLMFGGLLTAAAIVLGAGDALGAPSGSVTASVKKGRLVVNGTGAADQVAIRSGDQLSAGVIQPYVDGTPQP